MKLLSSALLLLLFAASAAAQKIPAKLNVEPGETHQWRVSMDVEMESADPETGALTRGDYRMNYVAEMIVREVSEDGILADLVAKDFRGEIEMDSAGRAPAPQLMHLPRGMSDTLALTLAPDGAYRSSKPKRGGLRLDGNSPGGKIKDFGQHAELLFAARPPHDLAPKESRLVADTLPVENSLTNLRKIRHAKYALDGRKDTLGHSGIAYSVRLDSLVLDAGDNASGFSTMRGKTSASGSARAFVDPETGLHRFVRNHVDLRMALDFGAMLGAVRAELEKKNGEPGQPALQTADLKMQVVLRMRLGAVYFDTKAE